MEYNGADIAEAIKNACEKLNVNQDQLDIQVKNTGSAGIFGLCRRKATILVSLKEEDGGKAAGAPPAPRGKAAPKTKAKPKPAAAPEPPPTAPFAEATEAAPAKAAPAPRAASAPKAAPAPRAATPKPAPAPKTAPQPVSDEAKQTVQADLERLLELIGYPSKVTVNEEEGKLRLHIGGEHTEQLIGPAGQVLDAIQYLLRKMISKKVAEKVQLTLDAGDFRETRLQELEETALRLAGEVRENGKTQSIPALNPAERRIVHMTLQNDTTIRSRSVGEGLFKKILIYLPGKGRKRGKGNRSQKPRANKDEQNNE